MKLGDTVRITNPGDIIFQSFGINRLLTDEELLRFHYKIIERSENNVVIEHESVLIKIRITGVSVVLEDNDRAYLEKKVKDIQRKLSMCNLTLQTYMESDDFWGNDEMKVIDEIKEQISDLSQELSQIRSKLSDKS